MWEGRWEQAGKTAVSSPQDKSKVMARSCSPRTKRTKWKQEAPGGKKRLTYAPLCVGVRLRNGQESPFLCPQRADGYRRCPALRCHDLESKCHPSASRTQAGCQSWGKTELSMSLPIPHHHPGGTGNVLPWPFSSTVFSPLSDRITWLSSARPPLPWSHSQLQHQPDGASLWPALTSLLKK